VAGNKRNDQSPHGYPEVLLRYFGQFIFWAVLMLVGWSFYTTQHLDKAVAVLEQRVTTLEENGK
jgi:hypothetical protein